MVRHQTLGQKKRQCVFCKHCDYMKLRQQKSAPKSATKGWV